MDIHGNSSNQSYRPYGAAEKLFYCKDTEILMEGASGTGKSRAALEKLHLLLCKYPNSRGLLLRKTRASLSESTMVTWETKVIPEGSSITSGAHRQARSVYNYSNGSTLVLGGLDLWTRLMSSEYDVIVIDEGTEFEEFEYEPVLTRLRNGKIPYNQCIVCCNPAQPNHFLNRRASEGKMTRLKSLHADNPTISKQYLETLNRLTGVRRQRLYEGLWSAAEGKIFPQLSKERHITEKDYTLADFEQLIVTVDFGYRHAGIFILMGLTLDNTLVVLKTLKRCEMSIDWWVGKGLEWQNKYNPNVFVADSARCDAIAQFNGAELPTIEAMKSVSLGLNLMQTRLDSDKLLICHDACVGSCPILEEKRKPQTLFDELDSYLWDGSGKEIPVKEDCGDDLCDGLRYGVAYFDFKRGGTICLI